MILFDQCLPELVLLISTLDETLLVFRLLLSHEYVALIVYLCNASARDVESSVWTPPTSAFFASEKNLREKLATGGSFRKLAPRFEVNEERGLKHSLRRQRVDGEDSPLRASESASPAGPRRRRRSRTPLRLRDSEPPRQSQRCAAHTRCARRRSLLCATVLTVFVVAPAC